MIRGVNGLMAKWLDGFMSEFCLKLKKCSMNIINIFAARLKESDAKEEIAG
jgi:hypothetical protein